MRDILLLSREFIACDSLSASSAYTPLAHSLKVLALVLLSDYKSSAIVFELYNSAIEFKVIVKSELLMLLG